MAENGLNAEKVSDIPTQKKITAAFKAFDHEFNNTVDVREIDTIMYSLGCFPSQADIHEIIAQLEEDHSGYIHLEKFLPVMTTVLLDNKFPPIPEDKLLQAFQVLDTEKKGYLDPGELTKYMTLEGEPFTQEEMDEMLTAFTDRKNNLIYYKDVISELTTEPDV